LVVCPKAERVNEIEAIKKRDKSFFIGLFIFLGKEKVLPTKKAYTQ